MTPPPGFWTARVAGSRLAAFTAVLFLSCAEQSVKDIPQLENGLATPRQAMVRQLDQQYRILDERILSAMRQVRRHIYIPEDHRPGSDPYGDHPCPIGHGQTISQPYIVAYMTEKMEIQPGEKVLEVGTGSGYQAAILSELGAEVYTIEIIPALAEHARRTLTAEGYTNVQVRIGDGYKGWPEEAPFKVIIVTCAPDNIPPRLLEQLDDGGRMVIPVGSGVQSLAMLSKDGGKITRNDLIMVRFVPMIHGE